MAITQLLDDRDPAVVYSPGWRYAGSPNESQATTTYANSPGLTATLVFRGIQVSVVGTIGPLGTLQVAAQSNYTVDDSTPITYQAIQNSNVQYRTLFYRSPFLSSGQHTLVITNLLASDYLFLDYFLVLRDDVDSTSTSPPSPLTQTATSTPGNSSPSSTTTGTIVGSAMGAAVLVVLAVGIMLWLRNKNRRTRDDPTINSFWVDQTISTNHPSSQMSSSTPVTQFASSPSPLGSSYQISSGGATVGSSQHRQGLYQRQNPQSLYDPYAPTPPGYTSEFPHQSGAVAVRRPGEYSH